MTPDFIREMYWKKGLSTAQIARSIGCSKSGVLYRMIKFDIERKHPTDSIVTSRGFVVGSLLADGYTKNPYVEFCVTDEDYIKEFANKIGGNYHFVMRDRGRTPCFYLYKKHEGICDLVDKFRQNPDMLLELPRQDQIDFIRGFFDGEGSVTIDPRFKGGWIRVVNQNLSYLRAIQKSLEKLGIESRIFKKKFGYLSIYKYWNLKKYADLVGFSIKRKQKKLLTLLERQKEAKRRYWTNEEIQILRENYLKKSDKELARILKRTPNTIRAYRMRLNLLKFPGRHNKSKFT